MKKIIILSFIALFFAGISNNANAQKAPDQTSVNITYNWHCTPKPDADLSVQFYGYDEDDQYQYFLFEGKVGSFSGINVYSGKRFKTVNVNIRVSGEAWASKSLNRSEDPYVSSIPVTLDIYSEPLQNPGW